LHPTALLASLAESRTLEAIKVLLYHWKVFLNARGCYDCRLQRIRSGKPSRTLASSLHAQNVYMVVQGVSCAFSKIITKNAVCPQLTDEASCISKACSFCCGTKKCYQTDEAAYMAKCEWMVSSMSCAAASKIKGDLMREVRASRHKKALGCRRLPFKACGCRLWTNMNTNGRSFP
jgi:hypothetical protein